AVPANRVLPMVYESRASGAALGRRPRASAIQPESSHASRPGKRDLRQGWKVEFGVNPGSGERAVPQDIGDFFETGAAPHHRGRQRVTQDIDARARSTDACLSQQAIYQIAQPRMSPQWFMWRQVAKKHGAF